MFFSCICIFQLIWTIWGQGLIYPLTLTVKYSTRPKVYTQLRLIELMDKIGWLDQHSFIHSFIQKLLCGLPWWHSGWESACQCREHGFEPWSGKIPHAAEQLGPWATTTEPARLEPVLCNKRGRDTERPAHRDEEWPPLAATGESPRTETKTQHSQK